MLHEREGGTVSSKDFNDAEACGAEGEDAARDAGGDGGESADGERVDCDVGGDWAEGFGHAGGVVLEWGGGVKRRRGNGRDDDYDDGEYCEPRASTNEKRANYYRIVDAFHIVPPF